jgi:hypothetical protein
VPLVRECSAEGTSPSRSRSCYVKQRLGATSKRYQRRGNRVLAETALRSSELAHNPRNCLRPNTAGSTARCRRVVMLRPSSLAERLQRSQSRVVRRLAVEIHRHCNLAVAQHLHGDSGGGHTRNGQSCAGLAGAPVASARRHAMVVGESPGRGVRRVGLCLSSKASSIAGVPGPQL